jgi:NitT/TauT family transport system substrate-binding protein
MMGGKNPMYILIKVKVVRLISVFLFGVAVSACATTTPTPPPLTSITVQFDWFHSAQFAGFYAADQNGDYTREGLAVTFAEGGPAIDSIASVLDGKAQIGLVGGDVLIPVRAEGKPLRAVATILRRDPFVLFSLADSGITRPEDFVGKKILLYPLARPRLYTMIAEVGITPNEFTEVNTGSFTDLYIGDIDVANGFVTDEVLRAQQAGYEVNIIYPDDYGVHFYSSTVFATDTFLDAEPDVVTRFLKATFRGWTYAIENPTAVGSLVVKYKPDVDVAFETEKMVAMLPFVNTGEDHIGWMKQEVWEGMAQTLRDQGILTTPLDVNDIYTLKFIQQIYEGS